MSLLAIRNHIDAALDHAGRPRGAVTLVAVSKTQAPDRVRAVLDEGQRVFGENRVQEAEERWTSTFKTEDPPVTLHLIGPLQTNKVNRAFGLFSAIHSLDREPLARKLASAAQSAGNCPCLFVQVNTGREPQKAGVDPGTVDRFLADCRQRYDLPVVGLMCIPPAGEDPEPHFLALAAMAERNGLKELSMGMSEDFEIAIACGATHVRIGSAIFGARRFRDILAGETRKA